MNEALKDIWVVSLVDRNASRAWIAGITLTLIAFLAGLSLEMIPWQPSDWVLSQDQRVSTELASPAFPIEFALMGLVLTLAFVFARKGVADIELLEKLNPGISVDSFTAKQVLLVQLVLSLFFFLLLKAFDVWLFYVTCQSYGMTDFTLTDAALAPLKMGDNRITHYLVSHGLLAISWAVLVTVIWHHSRRLNEFARSVYINIMDLADYAIVSNAAVRLVITVGILLSFFPVASLFIFKAIDKVVFVHIALVAAGSIPLTLMLSRSIRVLHNRIGETKSRELHTIRTLMAGTDTDADLMGGAIKPSNKNDLLTYQMFVETRWEWPIAPHVQKLLIFGLLPPATWVLAAFVENLLY